MSLIKDEIKRETVTLPHVTRTQTDVQRLKLEKLMNNPEKPVVIPERAKERGPPVVPDFVRNVMGSSAGAGSGEFHVYRHLRRKEYARQNFMQKRAQWEKLEQEYHQKIEQNKRKAEEQTAKKRAKRLKKKNKRKHGKNVSKKSDSSGPDSDEGVMKDSRMGMGNEFFPDAEYVCSPGIAKDNPEASTELELSKPEYPIKESPVINENDERLEEMRAPPAEKDDSIIKYTVGNNL